MLKPGKLNGAPSDRNKAVSGLNINGEIMLAKELMPEMHPWAFPCSLGPTCFDAMLRMLGCTKIVKIENTGVA